MPVHDVINHVRVDLDARIVDPSKRRRAQIADSRRRRAYQNNFSFECSRGKFVADHIGDRNIRIGRHATFVIDHHSTHGIRMDDERGTKFESRDARLAEIELHLLIGHSLKKAHRLHIQRAVQIPKVQILGAPVRKR